jgi:hypothetical protein
VRPTGRTAVPQCDGLARAVTSIRQAEAEQYVEYLMQLCRAHIATEQAFEVLYQDFAPKRSLWHRLRLRWARRILFRLYGKELNRKEWLYASSRRR